MADNIERIRNLETARKNKEALIKCRWSLIRSGCEIKGLPLLKKDTKE
jgi:hypothetical protein